MLSGLTYIHYFIDTNTVNLVDYQSLLVFIIIGVWLFIAQLLSMDGSSSHSAMISHFLFSRCAVFQCSVMLQGYMLPEDHAAKGLGAAIQFRQSNWMKIAKESFLLKLNVYRTQSISTLWYCDVSIFIFVVYSQYKLQSVCFLCVLSPSISVYHSNSRNDLFAIVYYLNTRWKPYRDHLLLRADIAQGCTNACSIYWLIA